MCWDRRSHVLHSNVVLSNPHVLHCSTVAFDDAIGIFMRIVQNDKISNRYVLL